jgi:hypothetical protein
MRTGRMGKKKSTYPLTKSISTWDVKFCTLLHQRLQLAEIRDNWGLEELTVTVTVFYWKGWPSVGWELTVGHHKWTPDRIREN